MNSRTRLQTLRRTSTIARSVITTNPFACVAYMTAKLNHDPVEKTKDGYTVKIVYQDSDAKVVGSLSDTFSTITSFTSSSGPSAAAPSP